MNKPRVSFEQAVRLKALGYDVPTDEYYHPHYGDKIHTSSVDLDFNKDKQANGYVSRPTTDDVFRWFRETHWLHVTVDLWQTDLTTEPIQHEWKSDIANMDDKEDAYNYTSGTYTEHDAAQSAAIDACLTILEKRKKTQQ